MSIEADQGETENRATTGDALAPATQLLRGQYTITSFLNAGGFGITYLAKDSLDRTVVIKECFPSSMCHREHNTVLVRSRTHQADFASIVKLFGNEARRLAKLQHPNIVGVHQVFEDNDTAYMALDFIEGQDLLTCLEEQSIHLSAEAITEMLLKLLDAVKYLHEQDILHRDISPDNILIDPRGEPILIDFGAAREEATRASRVLSSIHPVKDGYSPQEFYIAGSAQGPSSDLYGLAATFYHLISGHAPPDSQQRVAAVAEGRSDPYVPLSTFQTDYDRFFVGAINRAMAIFPKERLQSAEEWILEIHTEKRRAAAAQRASQDRQVEASIFKIVAETNQAVLADQVAEDKNRGKAHRSNGKAATPLAGRKGPSVQRSARVKSRAEATDAPPSLTRTLAGLWRQIFQSSNAGKVKR
jgi:serine/threonine protein kinase